MKNCDPRCCGVLVFVVSKTAVFSMSRLTDYPPYWVLACSTASSLPGAFALYCLYFPILFFTYCYAGLCGGPLDIAIGPLLNPSVCALFVFPPSEVSTESQYVYFLPQKKLLA